ncbi:MAG: dihydroneopterin aldolase [Bacillota bacterium]
MTKTQVLTITGAVFYAYHGATQEQMDQGQRFILDVEVEANLDAACLEDDTSGISHKGIYDVVETVATKERFNLMQPLAKRVIDQIKAKYPVCKRIKVGSRKEMCPFYHAVVGVPGAGGFIREDGGCGVVIERSF